MARHPTPSVFPRFTGLYTGIGRRVEKETRKRPKSGRFRNGGREVEAGGREDDKEGFIKVKMEEEENGSKREMEGRGELIAPIKGRS